MKNLLRIKQDENLRHFLFKLEAHFKENLKRVILFGSRARGDSAEDSDYDLLIILDKVTPETNELIDELSGEMLYEYNAVFSVFVYTEKDLDSREYSPFIMNLRKEAVEL